MKKLNIVIDASNIFYRTLFTVSNYNENKSEKFMSDKKTQDVFMRKLVTDFVSLVKMIDEPGRVIVCLDDVSWRKKIIIEGGGYKIDRKQSLDIDWESFFGITNSFISILSEKGYIISRQKDAEGDDLMYLWSKKLNDMDENVIIITGDKDMWQVIKKTSTNAWTVVIDPVSNRRKISMTEKMYNEIDSKNFGAVNLFDSNTWSSSDSVLKKLIGLFDVNLVVPEEVRMMKILLGDKGDSVPGSIKWKDKKDESKIHFMTENNFNKIFFANDFLKKYSWKDLYKGKGVDDIVLSMSELKKVKIDLEESKKNIERNCRLVVLSHETIPSEIIEKFDEINESVPCLVPILSKELILEGTEWWTTLNDEYVPNKYDVF